MAVVTVMGDTTEPGVALVEGPRNVAVGSTSGEVEIE